MTGTAAPPGAAPPAVRVWPAYRFWRFVIGKLLFMVPFRVRVEGRELIPAEGPVVLVSNHTSFLDPPLVGAACPRPVRFVARSSLGHNPLLGWWMRQVGTVLIDRDGARRKGKLDEAVRLLSESNVMAVFPEGTRSPDGHLHEFRRGLLKLLQETGATVVPTAIIGGFEAWPRHRRLPRLRRCRVRFGSPLSAAEVCTPGGLERLREAVAGLSGQQLAPVAGSAEPA